MDNKGRSVRHARHLPSELRLQGEIHRVKQVGRELAQPLLKLRRSIGSRLKGTAAADSLKVFDPAD
jgi:hypothetical protein